MRLALVADLHIHNWAEFSPDGRRLTYCLSVLDDVREYCTSSGIGVVVLAGDLFHRRGVVYTQPYNEAVKRIRLMREAGLVVLVVDGNHDHADKSGSIHTVQALSESGLVEAVPGDGWINWHLSDGVSDLVVSGFSYCDDRSVFDRRVEASYVKCRKEYPSVPRIGVFHHGFTGAAVGATLEYVVKEDIDPAPLIEQFVHLFSGHYHRRQFIGGSSTALYIGSPLEHVRGDGGIQKGFIVYDSEEPAWTLVPLERPRFVTLTQEHIDGKAGSVREHVTGNFVDVVYEELPVAWSDYEAKLRKYGAVGVKAVPVKRKTAAKKRLEIDPSMSTEVMLRKYIEYRDTGLDREALLRLGLELFHKAAE